MIMRCCCAKKKKTSANSADVAKETKEKLLKENDETSTYASVRVADDESEMESELGDESEYSVKKEV